MSQRHSSFLSRAHHGLALLYGSSDDRVAQHSSPLSVIEGENRFVSILFSDLSGYFSRVYELSGDEAAEIVSPVLRAMIDIVSSHRGCVIRCHGDGILAVFGAPDTHENDAERAVIAALEIKNAAHPYGFRVKSGINTGLIYLGWIGSDHYKEVAVTGIVADLAARLQSKAKPDEVLVGNDTFFQVRSVFSGLRRRLKLKGAPEPFVGYAIDKRVNSTGVHPRNRGTTRLINRDRELSSLSENALALLQGAGQTIFLWGDAGIGKSRLLSEFYNLVRFDERLVKTELFRLEWGESCQGTQDSNGNLKKESSTGLRAQFRNWKNQTSRPQNSSGLDLNSLEHLRQVLTHLSKADTLRCLKPGDKSIRSVARQISNCLRSIKTGNGALVILENLHWADREALEYVECLIWLTSHLPVMAICVCRPGREYSNWRLMKTLSHKYKRSASEMFIEELSSKESVQLLQSLSLNRSLSPAAFSAVLNRGRGNPLYLEELSRLSSKTGKQSISRSGTSVRHPPMPPVPSSILKITASRISRLDQHSRRIIQIASVIGPHFSKSLLSRVAKMPWSRLRRVVYDLEERRLVFRTNDESDESFDFTDAMLHQTVYEGLRLKDRRMLHRRVAHAITHRGERELERGQRERRKRA